ncbi:Trehalose transport system permease protein SugA [Granulosicoccus antarcticus IMCC3135]|uniref:Trehalose transport system permease protein SugA n=1 Tax=Granulosicoccus antarcticus IMCC3135 TaxID=1192854 RepID=A0A2Z2NI59_9GAMM|nr:Trehalose transport system permease protein SugA [Granulosicoccus antarcticus IMCC3135]
MTAGASGNRLVKSRMVATIARILPLAPATLMIVGFFLIPILWAVFASLTNQGLTGAAARNPVFIGLENYYYLFTDSRTWDALARTAVFVVFSVLGQNVIGFSIAYARQRASQIVQSIVTTVMIIAWVVPEVVAGYLWYSFLSAESGALNQFFSMLGMERQEWLVTDPLAAVIFINIWRGCAFSLLIYGAALQDVSSEVIEAAEIDGAGSLRKIFGVILPIIRPVILINVVLTTLATLGVFGLIWVVTAGGPGTRSETLPIYMYTQAYDFGLIGYGSAIAVLLLSLGMIASLVYVRLFNIGDKQP